MSALCWQVASRREARTHRVSPGLSRMSRMVSVGDLRRATLARSLVEAETLMWQQFAFIDRARRWG